MSRYTHPFEAFAVLFLHGEDWIMGPPTRFCAPWNPERRRCRRRIGSGARYKAPVTLGRIEVGPGWLEKLDRCGGSNSTLRLMMWKSHPCLLPQMQPWESPHQNAAGCTKLQAWRTEEEPLGWGRLDHGPVADPILCSPESGKAASPPADWLGSPI